MKRNIYTPEFFKALINQGSANPADVENTQDIETRSAPSTWKVLFELLNPSTELSR